MDKTLSYLTLAGVILIISGFVAPYLSSSLAIVGSLAIMLGCLLIFIQSIITVCTWKKNKLSENIAAVGAIIFSIVIFVAPIMEFIAKDMRYRN